MKRWFGFLCVAVAAFCAGYYLGYDDRECEESLKYFDDACENDDDDFAED